MFKILLTISKTTQKVPQNIITLPSINEKDILSNPLLNDALLTFLYMHPNIPTEKTVKFLSVDID